MRPRHEVVVVVEVVVVEVVEGIRTSRGGLGEASPYLVIFETRAVSDAIDLLGNSSYIVRPTFLFIHQACKSGIPIPHRRKSPGTILDS